MQGAFPSQPASALYSDCQVVIRISETGSADSSILMKAQHCVSYIDGFVNGLRMRPGLACVADAQLPTLARVYVAYVDQHPKLLDGATWPALLLALEESYPCPVKK